VLDASAARWFSVFYLKGLQMKKTVLAALLGAAICSPWPALAESAYFKVGLGPSRYSMPGNSEAETAWNLAYGQSLDSNWGYEVGYIHFGNASRLPVNQQSSNFRSQALYAAAVASMPLNQSTQAYAKVGLAVIESKGSGSSVLVGSVSESRTNTNLMAGLGLDYRFSPQVSGNIEYQYFGDTYRMPLALSAWTVGLKYGF
jgi:opacity protein-like surface antigen